MLRHAHHVKVIYLKSKALRGANPQRTSCCVCVVGRQKTVTALAQAASTCSMLTARKVLSNVELRFLQLRAACCRWAVKNAALAGSQKKGCNVSSAEC